MEATEIIASQKETIKKIKLQINRNVNKLLGGRGSGLSVCVPPKFMCWILPPSVMVVEGRAFGLGDAGGT